MLYLFQNTYSTMPISDFFNKPADNLSWTVKEFHGGMCACVRLARTCACVLLPEKLSKRASWALWVYALV